MSHVYVSGKEALLLYVLKRVHIAVISLVLTACVVPPTLTRLGLCVHKNTAEGKVCHF